jgi:hypothetical protein
MTPRDAATPAHPHPSPSAREAGSVRAYTVLCLTALMGMVLALEVNDRELLWILLLAAVGAVGVVARWRIGPPLLLLGLAVLEVYHHAIVPWYLRNVAWHESPLMNAVLCASVLAYAAGHYRLLSLVRTVFPIDYRRPPALVRARGERRPPPALDGRLPRSANLPGPWEMPMLAITAAVWAVAVSLFWFAISGRRAPLDMPSDLWRGLLLIFLVGATMAVLAGATAYLHWSMATPAEHLLYLQDQLWRETRREQNRINRWLQWARLRGQRRKERS